MCMDGCDEEPVQRFGMGGSLQSDRFGRLEISEFENNMDEACGSRQELALGVGGGMSQRCRRGPR